MKTAKAAEILKIEKKCVDRQDNQPFGQSCNRDCAKCDLLLPTEDVLLAYNTAIKILESTKVVEIDGKLFDLSRAKIKTYHPGDGEYSIGYVFEAEGQNDESRNVDSGLE